MNPTNDEFTSWASGFVNYYYLRTIIVSPRRTKTEMTLLQYNRLSF